jgi:bacteriorhodopsin
MRSRKGGYVNTLSELQYNIVVTAMTGSAAALGAALLYYVLVRSTISSKYHTAMAVSSVVVGFAAFHYLRIIDNFKEAYVHDGNQWIETGIPFQHGFRYIDWFFTVPLLLTTLVLVLRLEHQESKRLNTRLMVSAAAMIALGYPGEVSDDTITKLVFWVAGCIPFAYIIYLLWVELNRSLFRYSDEVGYTVARARLLLVGSWMVYPVAFLFPIFDFDDATGDVVRQVLYSTADVVAKAGFGLLVYRIARILTEEEARGVSSKSAHQVDLADAGRGFEAPDFR